jgi:hypothetical protein
MNCLVSYEILNNGVDEKSIIPFTIGVCFIIFISITIISVIFIILSIIKGFLKNPKNN